MLNDDVRWSVKKQDTNRPQSPKDMSRYGIGIESEFHELESELFGEHMRTTAIWIPGKPKARFVFVETHRFHG